MSERNTDARRTLNRWRRAGWPAKVWAGALGLVALVGGALGIVDHVTPERGADLAQIGDPLWLELNGFLADTEGNSTSFTGSLVMIAAIENRGARPATISAVALQTGASTESILHMVSIKEGAADGQAEFGALFTIEPGRVVTAFIPVGSAADFGHLAGTVVLTPSDGSSDDLLLPFRTRDDGSAATEASSCRALPAEAQSLCSALATSAGRNVASSNDVMTYLSCGASSSGQARVPTQYGDLCDLVGY